MADAKKSPEKQSPEELIRFVENLKQQWVSTIDALVDPLMIVTKDYKIHKANKSLARMAGTNVKDLIGSPCYKAFANREKPCSGCKMKEFVDQSTSGQYELDNIHADKFFEVASQPLYDSDEKFIGAVQVYRDRTHAKRLQEQLMQQEKLASIGLLAGGVAHEINNPLGGILIFSQMLLKEMDKASPHYQDVVEIEAATQRCKAIVESLLDFARQQPARRNKEANINVIEAIQTALRLGKVSTPKGTIDIDQQIDEDLAHHTAGDRNKLIQLFLNLIQNAIQAMPDGGRLIVRGSTEERAGELIGVYEVQDTGIGIAPEYVKKVFDPFFTTKDPGEGTGLGLALCYGIAQEMGGTMECESTVNVGSTFRIELPLVETVPNKESA